MKEEKWVQRLLLRICGKYVEVGCELFACVSGASGVAVLVDMTKPVVVALAVAAANRWKVC